MTKSDIEDLLQKARLAMSIYWASEAPTTEEEYSAAMQLDSVLDVIRCLPFSLDSIEMSSVIWDLERMYNVFMRSGSREE